MMQAGRKVLACFGTLRHLIAEEFLGRLIATGDRRNASAFVQPMRHTLTRLSLKALLVHSQVGFHRIPPTRFGRHRMGETHSQRQRITFLLRRLSDGERIFDRIAIDLDTTPRSPWSADLPPGRGTAEVRHLNEKYRATTR
jgi:hypothetical protein